MWGIQRGGRSRGGPIDSERGGCDGGRRGHENIRGSRMREARKGRDREGGKDTVIGVTLHLWGFGACIPISVGPGNQIKSKFQTHLFLSP
jgi:hypothetical protein